MKMKYRIISGFEFMSKKITMLYLKFFQRKIYFFIFILNNHILITKMNTK